jgi:hypothetical protein
LARADVLPALQQAEESLLAAQKSLAAVHGADVAWPRVERLCKEITRRAEAATPAVRAEILSTLLTSVDVYADRLEIQGALGDLEILRAGHQLASTRRSR